MNPDASRPVRVRQLTRTFGDFVAVDHVDFDFHEGEFVLGGVHVTTAGGSYGAQEDWLDFDLDASLPEIPTLAEGAQQ